MAKKSDAQLLEDYRLQQKKLAEKIVRLENKQLIRIGKSAQHYSLTQWHETSLDNAFKFLKEQGEQQFKA
ncbi:hypothetical protein [Francisella sp. TX07-6608]|uniref:hypothetical protein n=1 Tax=Francisella sp. TX07-6608 TaxID=573568 RepID=UPI0008F9DA27|nr:hypothetical protein [Francisella sp. TX07-6608]OIN85050.1 hypothetical protein KX00_2179 [Francisella sp. TX07-6608]